MSFVLGLTITPFLFRSIDAEKSDKEKSDVEKSSEHSSTCYDVFWRRIKSATHGWRLYMVHSIRNAGLGLAFLYMTVLGFDNITYGFCLAQCVTEWVLGLLVGVSAIVGVIGSVSFPFLRKRIGLAKTGIVGMVALIATLSLCVVSIWLDGSPFDPYYYETIGHTNHSLKYETTTQKNNVSNVDRDITNTTTLLSNEVPECTNFLSVSVLLSGLILARFGLWVSDLTVTQIIQVSHQYTLIKTV